MTLSVTRKIWLQPWINESSLILYRTSKRGLYSLCSGLKESTRSWKLPDAPEPETRSHNPVSQPCSKHFFSLSNKTAVVHHRAKRLSAPESHPTFLLHPRSTRGGNKFQQRCQQLKCFVHSNSNVCLQFPPFPPPPKSLKTRLTVSA